jgi:hypothetical protein
MDRIPARIRARIADPSGDPHRTTPTMPGPFLVLRHLHTKNCLGMEWPGPARPIRLTRPPTPLPHLGPATNPGVTIPSESGRACVLVWGGGGRGLACRLPPAKSAARVLARPRQACSVPPTRVGSPPPGRKFGAGGGVVRRHPVGERLWPRPQCSFRRRGRRASRPGSGCRGPAAPRGGEFASEAGGSAGPVKAATGGGLKLCREWNAGWGLGLTEAWEGWSGGSALGSRSGQVWGPCSAPGEPPPPAECEPKETDKHWQSGYERMAWNRLGNSIAGGQCFRSEPQITPPKFQHCLILILRLMEG